MPWTNLLPNWWVSWWFTWVQSVKNISFHKSKWLWTSGDSASLWFEKSWTNIWASHFCGVKQKYSNQFDYINLGVKPTNIDHYFGFHFNTCFEIYHLWSHLGEKNHTKNVKHHWPPYQHYIIASTVIIFLVYGLNTTSVHMTDFEPYHVVPYSITAPSSKLCKDVYLL